MTTYVGMSGYVGARRRRRRMLRALTGLSALGALCIAVTAQAVVALSSALLPTSRSVQVGDTATAFATIINGGNETATGCTIAPAAAFGGTFFFQETDPLTNVPVGSPNQAVDISSGGLKTFVIGFEPDAAFDSTDTVLVFDCANSNPAPTIFGVNTLTLSASVNPIPDIVALGATVTNDGIAVIPFRSATGFFTVATVNVGATGLMQAAVGTRGSPLPLTLSICETDPATSVCTNPTVPTTGSVMTQIGAGDTPTFAVFATANDDVDLEAATRRLFVSFSDDADVVRGATSVAVRTRQYYDDLQPIFDANCTSGCHQPGGIAPFSLEDATSYDNLLASRVVPFDPAASELIRRLEGTSQPRMPLNGAPLSNALIQLFIDWINAGAPEDVDDSGGGGGGGYPPGEPPGPY